MYKKLKRSLFLAVSLSSAFVAPAFAVTAQEIIDKTIANLIGPPGRMVVSTGNMKFARRDLDIRTARYYRAGTEGFQMDIHSMMEDQEVAGSSPQTGKKYRVVRTAQTISTLTYLPSLRRGRMVSYVPLDGVLGSDFKYYLLPLVSNMMHDFSYAFVNEDPDAPIILGMRRAESRSPYTQVELQLIARGDFYLVQKAVYTTPNNKQMYFEANNYYEYTKGYWAPEKIVVDETTFTFSGWAALKPKSWLHKKGHHLLGTKQIPKIPLNGPTGGLLR